MNFIAICLHSLDMRDFHSYMRDTPFLDSLREKSIFIPMGRAQAHHEGDSLNAELTGVWTARFSNSELTPNGYMAPSHGRLPLTVIERLQSEGYEIITNIGNYHDFGSWAARANMERLWLKDEPQRRAQFNHPAGMTFKDWLERIKQCASEKFYAHIFLRETHRPWHQEKELFALAGVRPSLVRWWRHKRGGHSYWPYDASMARRLALEKPDAFAALRRRSLSWADRKIARVFEETKDLRDVTYLVYSNHGEVFDHFRYNLPYPTSHASGLPMVEGTSHGIFPYEVVYANMQMWVVPGKTPAVMSGIGRSIDIPATILDLASIPAEGLDGESMLDNFDQAKFPPRERYAETPRHGGCLSMVRDDGKKLIAVGRAPDEEFATRGPQGFPQHQMAVFDLTADPYEYVNLIHTDHGREVVEWAIDRHRSMKA